MAKEVFWSLQVRLVVGRCRQQGHLVIACAFPYFNVGGQHGDVAGPGHRHVKLCVAEPGLGLSPAVKGGDWRESDLRGSAPARVVSEYSVSRSSWLEVTITVWPSTLKRLLVLKSASC